jgi:hypothetical protein
VRRTTLATYVVLDAFLLDVASHARPALHCTSRSVRFDPLLTRTEKAHGLVAQIQFSHRAQCSTTRHGLAADSAGDRTDGAHAKGALLFRMH